MNTLILLASLGIVTLLSEIFNFKKVLYPIVLLGLAAALPLTLNDWNSDQVHFHMLRFDNYALAFTTVIVGVALLWFVMAKDFLNDDDYNKTNYFALVLFSLVGAVIMTSYTNMAMLFLGIEILSIPMYVLAGSNKKSLASNEAAFKYLIMGAFATGFLLFGITLVYGATGFFDLSEITIAYKMMGEEMISPIYHVGVLLILIGMLFKVSAAPFHFWAPDVYQGAPTEVTAFMATIVKTAAFAAFVRLFHSAFSDVSETWTYIIWIIAALTLLLGNITAVLQTNVKRMLAYSSVAHAGYMLLALLSDNEYSQGAILYYVIAYSVGSIATFSIVNIVSKASDTEDVSAFNGLAKSNPFLAAMMTIALLSLAGIPPMSGFFAKFSIFVSAFVAGNEGLVIIAIIASLIGVYYYFKLIIAMYFKTAENSANAITIDGQQKLLLIIVSIITIALGLFPDFIIKQL